MLGPVSPARLLLGCLVLGSMIGCTHNAPPPPQTTVPPAPPPLQFGTVGATLPAAPKVTQTSLPRRKTASPPPAAGHPPGVVGIDAVLEIKVAIAAGVERMTIGTSTPGQVLSGKGGVLYQLAPQQPYTLGASGDTILLGEWQLPSGTWIQPTPGGYFSVGDRAYRGRLLLLANSGRLLAVNYVLLQDYLASVVGSEVSPDWPAAALKAQAVAARSYALTYYFKPANGAYNLGDTESYQVYTGITRETKTTRQAVQATSGEFLSYRGGIVESLYAASDDLVAVAHGGRGMSQLGALRLAQQGQSYEQILLTYYPGTGIAHIALDQD